MVMTRHGTYRGVEIWWDGDRNMFCVQLGGKWFYSGYGKVREAIDDYLDRPKIQAPIIIVGLLVVVALIVWKWG